MSKAILSLLGSLGAPISGARAADAFADGANLTRVGGWAQGLGAAADIVSLANSGAQLWNLFSDIGGGAPQAAMQGAAEEQQEHEERWQCAIDAVQTCGVSLETILKEAESSLWLCGLQVAATVTAARLAAPGPQTEVLVRGILVAAVELIVQILVARNAAMEQCLDAAIAVAGEAAQPGKCGTAVAEGNEAVVVAPDRCDAALPSKEQCVSPKPVGESPTPPAPVAVQPAECPPEVAQSPVHAGGSVAGQGSAAGSALGSVASTAAGTVASSVAGNAVGSAVGSVLGSAASSAAVIAAGAAAMPSIQPAAWQAPLVPPCPPGIDVIGQVHQSLQTAAGAWQHVWTGIEQALLPPCETPETTTNECVVETKEECSADNGDQGHQAEPIPTPANDTQPQVVEAQVQATETCPETQTSTLEESAEAPTEEPTQEPPQAEGFDKSQYKPADVGGAQQQAAPAAASPETPQADPPAAPPAESPAAPPAAPPAGPTADYAPPQSSWTPDIWVSETSLESGQPAAQPVAPAAAEGHSDNQADTTGTHNAGSTQEAPSQISAVTLERSGTW